MKKVKTAYETALFRLKILVAVLICVQLAILLAWLDAPLLDSHAFRQTQTVLSAYWLFEPFDLFAYITPVLGAPWSIPFEFPLYQLFVAVLAKLVPDLGFDASARLVSCFFSVLAALPLFHIVKRYAGNDITALTAQCFYLACPATLFWARTGMIESSALFFSLACFWYLICLGDRPSWFFVFMAAICGITAALVKVTTIPVYMLAGYAHILVVNRRNAGMMRKLLLFILPGACSLLAVYLWSRHADAVKLLNPIGAGLTADRLMQWNFGTLEQRLSGATWLEIATRLCKHSLTRGGAIVLTCATLYYCLYNSKKDKIFGILCFICFIIPMAIFTNLHYRHDYYQLSCLVFLLAGCAFLMSPPNLFYKRHIIFVAIICIAFITGFNRYYKLIKRSYTKDLIPATKIVIDNTDKDSSMLAYGFDWSSEAVYYSQRKGLAMHGESDMGMINIAPSRQADIGGLPLQAIVIQDKSTLSDKQRNKLQEILAVCPGATEHTINNITVYILKKHE